MSDAFTPDLSASNVSEHQPLMIDRRITTRNCQVHEPNRFLRGSTSGTGNAGDGDSEGGSRIGECATDHGTSHILAHRAVPLDEPDRHAEQLALRRVGVGDEAAL